jgi:sec-independent protein translocase protein TatA
VGLLIGPASSRTFSGRGIRILKLLLVLFILLVLFSSRLPSVARSLGQSITEFKRGYKELDDQTKNDKSE